MDNIRDYVEAVCKKAKDASRIISLADTEKKNQVILRFAEELKSSCDYILSENAEDVKAARENGTSEAMCDRLALSKARIEGIVDALAALTELPDPVGSGEVFRRPNGMEIKKIKVPLGAVGVIYEARPNVSADIA